MESITDIIENLIRNCSDRERVEIASRLLPNSCVEHAAYADEDEDGNVEYKDQLVIYTGVVVEEVVLQTGNGD